MPWQNAEPGTLAKDEQGNYHIKQGDQWIAAPPGSVAKDEQGAFHFNSDALTQAPPAPAAAAAPAKPQLDDGSLGTMAKNTAGALVGAGRSLGDAALSGASKVATGVVGAPVALVNRLIAALSGGDPQAAADAAHEYVNRTFGYDAQTPGGKAIGHVVSSLVAPFQQSAQADEQLLEKGGEKVGIPAGETHGALSEAGDIAGTVGLAAPVVEGAAASTALEGTRANAAALDASHNLGLRTSVDHPIAAAAAGSSGREALTLQNNRVGTTVAGAEAGVPHGTTLTAGDEGTLGQARTAPNAVYQRVQDSLPTAPLSPQAAAKVQSAGTSQDVLTKASDTTQAAIDAQKQALLQGPLTGQQVVQTSRALRQEGYARVASDDVEQQKLGMAQLDMARALEQHVADTIPPGASTSLEQFQAARTALAKNYSVEGALRGQYVNLQQLAKIDRADPGVMTGNLKVLADFANNHPEVSSLPAPTTRYSPPGFAKDIAHINVINPRSWFQPLVGHAARGVLVGDPAEAMAAARTAPVTGLGGEFAPQVPGQLPMTQPPGPVPGPSQRELPLGPGMAPPHVNDVRVGEGAAGSPGTRPGGATGLGTGVAAPSGLRVGEGAAGSPGTRPGGATGLGTEFAPSGLNAGEGAAGSPGTRPGGSTGLEQALGDLFGLNVGENKNPKKRR